MYRYVAVIFLVLGNHRLLGVHASGNIGCLFSDTLCEQDREWCFDDYAFGRCLPLYGHVKEDDLHRYDLGTQELHLLEQEMQRLFLLGYRWSHIYTQCVLQALLNTIRFRKSFDVTSCNKDLDQDLEGALKAIEGEELDHIDPRDLAIVRFTPSETDPHAPYADEVYFPPIEHNELPHNPQLKQQQEPSEANSGAISGSAHDGGPGASDSPPAQSHLDLAPHDSLHQQQPQPPPHNYGNYYGAGGDYEDVDVYPYSPHQYSPPLNPVYRKRADFDNQEISPEKIAKIAAILDDMRNKGPFPHPEAVDAEETVFFPERLYEKEEQDKVEEDNGVFGEGPAKPMYTEGGMQFVPEIEGEHPEESVWSKFSNLDEPWIQVGMPNQDHLMGEPNIKEALLPLLSHNEPLPRHFFTEPEDNSINSLLMQEEPALEENSLPPFDQILLQEELNRITEPGNLKKLKTLFGPQLNALNDYDTEYEYPEYGLSKGNDYQYYDYDGDNNNAHVFVKKDEESAGDSLDLLTRTAWSFQRPERLDVKKPGPFYENSKNNFAFNYEEPIDAEDLEQADEAIVDVANGGSSSGNALLDRLMEERSQGSNSLLMPQPKTRAQPTYGDVVLAEEGFVEDAHKAPFAQPFKGAEPPTHIEKDAKSDAAGPAQAAEAAADSKALAAPVATTLAPLPKPLAYVYISTKANVTMRQAEEMIGLICKKVELSEEYIKEIKVVEDQVKFHVLENPGGITATIIAKKAEELRDVIAKEVDGVEITEAGLGDQSSISAVVFSSGEARILAAAAIVCGVMAALLVAASVLYFLRRHHKTKAKLQGLTSHDTEASKDYQDLCRARMANKAGGDGGSNGGTKTDTPTPHNHAPSQRVSSLSRDSDNGNNSPSSRSSTSSWSEEPVTSNMDISTGHMVLSYMEDHLQNKDRLEQEWIALCAYEAEPCATTLALNSENAPKNRYPDCVPYDHNRVVVSASANVNGSDYMNASSITDHDPRNPAYIATQGPLDSTAADFWQMVWEQGSVVIVMLTRLTENGHAFCYRYWPEEGSELYHIYEVHLVSEHIWCDDYLVRSFYLKNVRTGETRTVTQFHFLSWPDSGIPASTKALLEFRRKVNKSYRGRSCPIIVHCSDGIGRTGTYCLIDMVLNRMAKGAKEIDIAATCEHIRDQRPNMVKSKVQFEFVLMAVAEEVHAILKALPQ